MLGLLCLNSASADPGQPDSVMVDSITVQMGVQAEIGVWTLTDEWLTGIEITLGWDWDSLIVDSFVFEPGRFHPATAMGYAPDSNAVLMFAFPTNVDLIAPGRLKLGTLFLSHEVTGEARLITIDTTTRYSADSLRIRTTSFSDTIEAEPFIPLFSAGYLDLKVCCVGLTGNIDCDPEGKANLADVTMLIDKVYITKPELCCEAAGNTDGDPEGKINLADISRLIDHIYVSKADTAPCP